MSQSDRRALFIDAEGPNEEALKKALAWLQQLGGEDSEKQNALLAVNTKNQLDGVLSSVIGDGPANELDKKNPVQLGDVEIRLMTKRIGPQERQSGPILALYPDKKLLKALVNRLTAPVSTVRTRSMKRETADGSCLRFPASRRKRSS